MAKVDVIKGENTVRSVEVNKVLITRIYDEVYNIYDKGKNSVFTVDADRTALSANVIHCSNKDVVPLTNFLEVRLVGRRCAPRDDSRNKGIYL